MVNKRTNRSQMHSFSNGTALSLANLANTDGQQQTEWGDDNMKQSLLTTVFNFDVSILFFSGTLRGRSRSTPASSKYCRCI
jgi:hypothetical protein